MYPPFYYPVYPVKGDTMSKSINQKLKLIYLLHFLEQYTDENHALSTQELIQKLEDAGIGAERKSIYDDMQRLVDYGYDILQSKSKDKNGYYLASRDFELAELKLLVDAVQSSKFITRKKSRELISKLEKLVSVHQAKELQRTVYVADRVKTMNESIYYTIDAIHRAMNENNRISFQYSEWGTDKKLHLRKNGERYEVSPYQLIWNDSNYYLVAFDEGSGALRHYRVDKMSSVVQLASPREGGEQFHDFNPAVYSGKTFGMFGGQETKVTIWFDKILIGVVMDRFGSDVDLRVYEDGSFYIITTIQISPQFFGWIAGFGNRAKILSPKPVARDYGLFLQEILELYE